jgi:uncharacterized repeat protein (TIGR03803 family)
MTAVLPIRYALRAIALLCGVTVLSSAQTESVLYTFQTGTDASTPYAGLVHDSAGNLYGTTLSGGVYNDGAVFKLDRRHHESVVYSFAGGNDGIAPKASLILDKGGNLYGTTSRGGTSADAGTIFKISPSGTETILYRFTGGSDGATPLASLLRDRSGNLYGTTYAGGDPSCLCGVVFKVSPSGVETVVHAFAVGTDGEFPQGGLIADSNGNLYGTTLEGGKYGWGSVFKIDPAGTETVFYSFNLANGTDGWQPAGNLVRDAAGNFYGTTLAGGQQQSCFGFGCGTVFRIDPSGNESVLYAFGDSPDGAGPSSGVVRDSAGNLYGTTYVGGPGGLSGFGVVFELDTHGNETVLYQFSGGLDGAFPHSSLILDKAGNLYGTAERGGPLDTGEGVVFKIKP